MENVEWSLVWTAESSAQNRERRVERGREVSDELKVLRVPLERFERPVAEDFICPLKIFQVLKKYQRPLWRG